MLELHPDILMKNGKKEFAILPYEEFVALQELLEDAEDLLTLRAAKLAEQDAPTMTFEQVKRELEL
jgi:hypothetical protein